MRDYIILNNKNSNEIKGLLIQNLPPITKPRIRAEIEEIDGRDGDIVTPLGYGAYDKAFSIGLYGDFDINEVIKYFDSEGIVVFSNEPNKYYNYKILEQIDFEKLIRFRTADVMMHVQPFKYSTTEGKETEEMETKTASGSEIDLPDTNNEKLQMEKLKGNTTQYNHDSVNMLPNDMATLSLYGITITKNDDGTYTINGTTTQDFNWTINDTALTLQANKNYFLSGCISGGDVETYCLYIGAFADTGEGVLINSSRDINDQVRIFIASGQTFNNAIFKPMLIEGTEAIPFEPYGMTTPSPQYPSEVKVVKGNNVASVSGKNLVDYLDVKGIGSRDGTNNITLDSSSIDGDLLTITKTYQQGGGILKFNNISLPKIEQGEIVTISFIPNKTIRGVVGISNYNGGGTNNITTYASFVENSMFEISLEALSTYDKLGIFIQGLSQSVGIKNLLVERGSTATPYVPYSKTDYPINLGNIELCKIGNYNDFPFKAINGNEYYDSLTEEQKNALVYGKWYVHKAIEKVVLNGSGDYAIVNAKNNSTYFQLRGKIFVSTPVSEKPLAFSTHFTGRTGGDLYGYDNVGFTFNLEGYLRINVLNTLASTIEDFKTWLSNNNVTLYYVLATPTEEEITDETLLAQLEALDNIYNQKGTTKITTNPEANNMPLSLDVSYTESRPITITNSGNIYSKPIFTIYGEGNIGVYLNDIQLFDINLGSEEQITIDVAEMQAYNKETKALKNRLVTGNYDKFLLKIGENKISFSGIVKKFEIENYSRWI